MDLLDIVLTLILGGGFLVIAVRSAFWDRNGPWWKRILTILSSVFMFVGAVGFFARFLEVEGGLNWLPQSFEWPVGYAEEVISMPSGVHVVTVAGANRVQVYDRNWRFLRGWHADAPHPFRLLPSEDDRIELSADYGRWRYVYTLAGNLVSRQYYPDRRWPVPEHRTSYAVPTPIWLWVFSSPAIEWGVVMVGIVMKLLISGRFKWRGAR